MLTTIVNRFHLLISDDSGMTTIEYALGQWRLPPLPAHYTSSLPAGQLPMR